MPSYKDNTGQTRHVEIDLPACDRCLDRLGVDLYDIISVGEIAKNVREFLKVVHCISAPNEEYAEWWKLHTGDALGDCVDATLEAVTSFFPSRMSKLIRESNDLVTESIDKALTEAQEAISKQRTVSPVHWELATSEESLSENSFG